jgi:hypothetical protein
MRPSPLISPLDALRNGVRDLMRVFYQGTAHEFRAVGIAIDQAMFDRVLGQAQSANAVTALDPMGGLFEIDVDGLRVQIVRKD